MLPHATLKYDFFFGIYVAPWRIEINEEMLGGKEAGNKTDKIFAAIRAAV